MTATAIERLVDLGSGPIATQEDTAPPSLMPLLGICNGFYAFESALHVFPSTAAPGERGADEWNAQELWRNAFPDFSPAWYCFAEDAFGGQFAINPEGVVCLLDPETGVHELIAANLEGWAQALLGDYRALTGWPVAHEWQASNGALVPGRRLIPKLPFVLGGAYAVDNLYDADCAASLRYRGEIAQQLSQLPDGASVKLRIVE